MQLGPEEPQASRDVRSLITQDAAQDPFAPTGAPGGAPSPMPQPTGVPWHGVTNTSDSHGINPSSSQGEVPAAAPLGLGAWAEPGPHAAPTQGTRHGMPPAAQGGIGAIDAASGMPPAGHPGLGSGLGGDAAKRVASQPPAASPAGSLADSLAQLEAWP